MNSSNWKLGTLAASALAATAFLSPAHAGTVTLSFAPATITTVGDPVSVDIVVDGLPSAAGGFSLFLDYGNLAFTGYTLGPGGTLGPSPLDLSGGDLGGTVDFAVLADFFITEPALFAAQNSGGPFTIATVNFTGSSPGLFTLGLRDVAISDFNGQALLACTGQACAGTNQVPEPMTPLLVAAALGALALTRKQKPA